MKQQDRLRIEIVGEDPTRRKPFIRRKALNDDDDDDTVLNKLELGVE